MSRNRRTVLAGAVMQLRTVAAQLRPVAARSQVSGHLTPGSARQTIQGSFLLVALALLSLPSPAQIINGNFEAGYVGYESDYAVGEGGGKYDLVRNPQSLNPYFNAFGDHTSGSGLMLVANASNDYRIVWRAKPSSPLVVGEKYEFSYWAASASLWDGNLARLETAVGGVALGAPVMLPNATGVWVQIKYTFTAYTAFPSITIRETTLQLGGADFAIDDIALRQVGGTSSRTFLITFTGFYGSAEGTRCGSQGSYPSDPYSRPYPGSGMVTALENVKRFLGSSVVSAGFTFFNEGKGIACQQPFDVLVDGDKIHTAAETWLKNQSPTPNDRLFIAGHSYGGNRARLFVEQIAAAGRAGRLPANLVKGLVLVDPIDWRQCNLAVFDIPEVIEQSLLCTPQLLRGPAAYSTCLTNSLGKAIVSSLMACDMSDTKLNMSSADLGNTSITLIREKKGVVLGLVSGYGLTIDGMPLPVNGDRLINTNHQTIDDLDTVQRDIVNSLRILSVPDPPIGLTYQIQGGRGTVSVQGPPDVYTYRVLLDLANYGSLVAETKLTTARAVIKGCTATLLNRSALDVHRLTPGERKTVDLEFRMENSTGVCNGSNVFLTLELESNREYNPTSRIALRHSL